MSKVHSGSAVPRHFVYILADGSFVVQWDEKRVQDILTGKYRNLDEEGGSRPIADYELNQLKSAGRVEHYNRNYVWLYALPEPNRFQTPLRTQERSPDRIRAYYVNTALPLSQLENVRAFLQRLGLAEDFSVQSRVDLVAVAGRSGAPFLDFKEAEKIQKFLIAKKPDIFRESAVAFVEFNQSERSADLQPEDNTDLSTLIASQTDVSVTRGKQLTLLTASDGQQAAVLELCQELQINVRCAATGRDLLRLLEDARPDLLLMDLELPDMHGWELLGKAREMGVLDEVSVIVIAEQAAPDHQSFALSVAQVEFYLVKPVARARLRQHIWMALKNRAVS